MCRASLEGSAGVRWVAEWGTFVESGFSCPGLCFGWLGFGVGAVRVGGVGWCIKAALGLVCLARFGRSRPLGLGSPGLRSGWGDCGGLARFSVLLLVGRRYLFLGHPIYPHFLKYSKYSTL